MPLDLPPDLETLKIPADLAARLRARAAERGEDWNRFAVAVLTEAVTPAPAEPAERQRHARAEAQAILNGSARPQAQVAADIRARHDLPDLSHLSGEELAARAEAALAVLPPEVITEAERQGVI